MCKGVDFFIPMEKLSMMDNKGAKNVVSLQRIWEKGV